MPLKEQFPEWKDYILHNLSIHSQKSFISKNLDIKPNQIKIIKSFYDLSKSAAHWNFSDFKNS